MKKKTYRKILMYAAILAATICFVFPIYWMLLTSLKPNEAILRLPPQFLPVNATLANYKGILTDGKFLIFYKNNIIVSGITTLVTLTLAVLAAYIDGCSKGRTLIQVILPLVKPGILAVGLYSFLISWEDFLWGLTLVNKTEMRTLASGIAMTYLGEYNYDWGRVMAAAVGAAVPILVIFIFLQKYMIAGLTAGAVKE